MSQGGRHPFNVRVYGLLLHEGKVLIADEWINGMLVTKFPGGGLEFGEGPAECVVREWKEELDLSVEVTEHFYTTDFFQRSAFRDDDQVLSIYYKLKALEPMKVELLEKPFDLKDGEREAFRWLEMAKATKEVFTFPIDRKVFGLLQA